MTWQEKGSADAQKAVCEKNASNFPRNGAMQKGSNQEKTNMVVSRLYLPVIPHKAVAEVSKIGNL